LIASSKPPPLLLLLLLLLLLPLHLPTPLNPGQPQLPDQMWKRKKGSRSTKMKEKQKKAHSVRDRRQSRDRRHIWTFKDVQAGQVERLE